MHAGAETALLDFVRQIIEPARKNLADQATDQIYMSADRRRLGSVGIKDRSAGAICEQPNGERENNQTGKKILRPAVKRRETRQCSTLHGSILLAQACH